MRIQLFLGWITILTLTSGLQAGSPQNSDALVSADPARLEIGAGQVGTLYILLSNADNVYGIDLQAAFDPAVVQVVDADSGQKGIQMTPGAFLKPDYVVNNLADNKAGRLRYIVTQLAPTPPAVGKGIVLSIQFRGKTAGTSSKLSIAPAVIADRHGVKQPVTSQGAVLVIVAPKPSTPTPVPSLTFIPAEPTWSAPTFTLVGNQPTARASTTATLNDPAEQPAATAPGNDPQEQPGIIDENDPARETIRTPGVSVFLITYVIASVACSALLLAGLLIWLLVVKRRKDDTRNVN